MLADYHVHSDFSWDCQTPMEAQVRAAIGAGMEELCFTDHVDYGVRTEAGTFPYRDVREELARLQKRYEGQIRLRYGAEFGVQTHTTASYRKDVREEPFDFIILSCHQVDNLEFDNQAYQKGKSQREYNEGYYREILETVRQFDGYSVLGHLDMILRYDRQGHWPFRESRSLVEKILEQVIRNGKGIEVNTSCFRYQIGDLTPSEDILRLYREMGGKILTLGSDAHRPEQLGEKIGQVKRRLRELGFDSLCTFRRMEPEFHRI